MFQGYVGVFLDNLQFPLKIIAWNPVLFTMPFMGGNWSKTNFLRRLSPTSKLRNCLPSNEKLQNIYNFSFLSRWWKLKSILEMHAAPKVSCNSNCWWFQIQSAKKPGFGLSDCHQKTWLEYPEQFSPDFPRSTLSLASAQQFIRSQPRLGILTHREAAK